MADTHLQINSDGSTAVRKTTLWPSKKTEQEPILRSIFEQKNWIVTQIENVVGSHWKIETKCFNLLWKINLYISSIRDESRQPDEFKMQLGSSYPDSEEDGWINLVLGIYTIDDGTSPIEYILSGYAIDRYDFSTNPSIRGTRTKGLQKAKILGLYQTDKSVLFRPEFIYYYIESQSTKKITDLTVTTPTTPSSPLPHQQIFYGAPGTGKSHTIKRVVEDGNLPHIRTTFHPDSDYSTFVGAYKPSTIEVPMRDVSGHIIVEDGQQVIESKIIYTFVPQAFLKAYVAAWSNLNEPFFLIIEEINRGNCAQIFGDLFQLLDRNSEGISDYPVTSDDDIRRYLNSKFSALDDAQRANIPDEILSGEKMLLPRNLHIWATMNTSDQSLFPIDSAFKRRWDWKYTPIANGNKNWKIAADGKEYDWWQFLEKINAQIGNATHSEDKKLGYYFCKPINNQTIDAETFVSKVVFYLWNDVFKDFAEDAGSIFNDEDGSVLSFNKFYTTDTDGNAVVVEQKVTQFLQNLGVAPSQNVE